MKTVRKALQILDTFTADIQFQGVTEIATKLGYQKSGTHALLATLKDEGYIIYDSNTKKYGLGFKILELSKRITYRLDLKNIARPVMQWLSEKIEEDIGLNIIVEGHRICIDLVESRYFVRQFIPIGKALPIHCSAAGKVLLAFQPEDNILRIIEQHGLPEYTSSTITDKKTLLQALKDIRNQSYAESREEYGRDAYSLAFPLIDAQNSVIASLSIQSTVNRISDETKKKFLHWGIEANNEINRILKSI